MEKKHLNRWYGDGIVDKYLSKNKDSDKKFSFLDGPITANNPMGVHHAWGRTYKDLWQRFYNMQGFSGRFQNGFDEQGLWVEVEVEKELGFKNKKDIEKFGIDKFVELCKARVKKFAAIQTEQSKRLGYFMDWEHSYHTSSDENNYAIWNFLKVTRDKGWLYKGRDSVPWCPRCGTAISQHEILTEEYKEVTHRAVFVTYKLSQSDDEMYLLVWTTTPWTLPSNVAVAVNPEMEYGIYEEDGKLLYAEISRAEQIGLKNKKGTVKGKNLIGLRYDGAFDELPMAKGVEHRVVSAPDLVNNDEGTGLVHIAPGAGQEDFRLAQELNLPVIESIDESATYIDGFGDLSGKNAKEYPDLVISQLKEKGILFKVEEYRHRYPTCWRCKTELVWRVVDEWYISMDKTDDSGKSYREQMVDVTKKIKWMPKWGLDRELDWLKNLHDWLISKKRYWGLALPIWECDKCGNFEVVGSKEELKEKAVEGWDQFEGHTPHRPWIDAVKIKCGQCGETITRIKDVGNPWLDAGIVPFSTMPSDWFSADFITESFPGQFKNWFYSLIAMSTALKRTNPFENLLGFATLLDEKGNPMHKSAGNSIEFNEAADKIGVDVMRWMYATQNPEDNLLFGYGKADEVRRRFYLILWNSYKFFVDYANLADWNCDKTPADVQVKLTVLDRWILVSLTKLVLDVNESLTKYDAVDASRAIEEFVARDLSTWYIRRSRDRVGPTSDKEDENIFLSTFYGVLVTLSKLMAPFTPFIAEEIYQNLTGEESVHLTDYPKGDKSLLDEELLKQMKIAREIVEKAHSLRKEANIKVRQPLSSLAYGGEKLSEEIEKIIAQEVNVKEVAHGKEIELNTNVTPQLKEEGDARDFIRSIQQLRKDAGCVLDAKIIITAPDWPDKFEEQIKRQTLATDIKKGDKTEISVV